MGRVVETKLLLTGEDRASKVFSNVAKAVDRTAKAFGGFDKATKAAKEVDQLTGAMKRAGEADALVGKLKAAKTGMDAVGKASGTMRGQVERDAKSIGRVLDQTAKGIHISDALRREVKELGLTRKELGLLARDAATAGAATERALSGVGNVKVREQIISAERATMEARLRERARGLAEARRLEERFSRELGAHVKAEGDRLAGVRRTFGTVAGYAGAGGVVYGAQRIVRGAVLSGADAVQERSRDLQSGLTKAQSARIEASAADLSSKYQSVETVTLHERLRDTAMSTGDVDKALAVGDTIAQATVVLQSLKGKDAAIEQGRRFFAALDSLGKNIDPAQITRLMDGWVKALGVEGADLDMGALLEMTRTAKSGGAALNEKFLMTVAPALMQDLGPSRLGTALGSEVAQVIGGRATKNSKAAQQDLGMRDRKGNFSKADRNLILSNPFEYTRERLIPMLTKKGVNVDDAGAVTAKMSEIFSNQVVADLFTKMITQRTQYDRKEGQYDKAEGLAAAGRIQKEDPYVAATAAQSQFNNAMGNFTKQVMPGATAALNAFADAMSGVSKFAKENPKTAAAGAVVGGVGGSVLVYKLLTSGFGLKGSALALTKSALAIDAAAARLGLSGAPGGPPSAAQKTVETVKDASKIGLAGTILRSAASGGLAAVIVGTMHASEGWGKKERDDRFIAALNRRRSEREGRSLVDPQSDPDLNALKTNADGIRAEIAALDAKRSSAMAGPRANVAIDAETARLKTRLEEAERLVAEHAGKIAERAEKIAAAASVAQASLDAGLGALAAVPGPRKAESGELTALRKQREDLRAELDRVERGRRTLAETPWKPATLKAFDRSEAQAREKLAPVEAGISRGVKAMALEEGLGALSGIERPKRAKEAGGRIGEALGEGVAKGVAAKTPEVEDEAQKQYDAIRKIFEQGVQMPIGFSGGGFGGGAGSGGGAGFGGKLINASFGSGGSGAGGGTTRPAGGVGGGLGGQWGVRSGSGGGSPAVARFGGDRYASLSPSGGSPTRPGGSSVPSDGAKLPNAVAERAVAAHAGPNTFDSLAPRIMGDLRQDFGLSKEQAAGVVGNLGHESGGFRHMQELAPRGGGRGGFGWAQWTGPRRREFEAYVKEKGLDPTSYEANYGFLRQELNTTEKGAIGAVRRADTAQGAMVGFENKFERAGVKAYRSRQKFTDRAMALPDVAEQPDAAAQPDFTPQARTPQTAPSLAPFSSNGSNPQPFGKLDGGNAEMQRAAARMNEAADRMAGATWRSHHSVEVSASPGLQAKTRNMQASATGPVRADVGISMPQTRGTRMA